MDNNAPIKYSDLIQPDDSIKDLHNQLEELGQTYTKLMNSIKSQVASVKSSIEGLSGATTQGQQAIKNASSMVDKLAKKEVELAQSTSEQAKQLAQKSAQLRHNNREMKLQEQLARSVAGSYDALSAEYGLIKMRLNAMSAEERKTTEEGQKLEERSASLMAQMKKLQEVTGKHTLSVGDYGQATAYLASDIRNGIQALTQMRIEMTNLEKEGKRGSDRWVELSTESQRLANDLKELKRQYQIVKLETNALGQQTGLLNDAIGVLSAGAGGLSALTGAVNLFGGSANGAAKALVELNSVMAIANGVSQVYNGIFKSGNLLLIIRTAQTKAATLAQNLQTKSTKAATVAQIAFNLVAKANPYVLLAMAIMTVVGALALFLKTGVDVIKQQKLMNQYDAASIEYLQQYAEESQRLNTEKQKSLEQELNEAKARKASYEETQRLENDLLATRKKNNAYYRGFYAQEIHDLDANRTELERLRVELVRLSGKADDSKVMVQFDINTPAQEVEASEAIDIIQNKINTLGKKVEIATQVVYDQKQLESDGKVLAAQHEQQMLEVEALERAALREAEDAQIALLRQRFNKERAIERANTARQIVDLKVRLQTESNLTIEAREAINRKIIDLRKKLAQNIIDINNQEEAANRAAIRELEDVRMEARYESADKQRALLKLSYDRDIEDLQTRLATEKDLTLKETEAINQQLLARWEKYLKEKYELESQLRQEQLEKESQSINDRLSLVSEETKEALAIRLEAIENNRKQEITSNRALSEELRRDEAEINAKYDRMIEEEKITSANKMAKSKLEVEQAYEESVFNLKEHSERAINRFQLKQQRERLQEELKAQQALLAIQTGEQKELTETTIETLKNQVKKVDKEIKKGVKVNNIWELFGFSSKAAEAIQIVTDQVLSGLKEITQARLEAAEAAVEQAQKEVESAQRFLEYQLEARANGYANEVETAQKELMLRKKTEEEALRDKKKAQEQQQAIDTLTQMSSLITASANLWASLSPITPVGPALAIAAIATMWGSFAYSKIKAKQLTSETYGEGTVELLRGGSHQSGNDVDLGTRKDGTKRRAEGGEYFAVINKRNSRKYGKLIPDVIHALNNGTFSEKYMGAYSRLGNMALATLGGSSTDVSKLEKDVEEIREQNSTKVYLDGNGTTVVVYKNLTRRIKN